MTTFDKEDQAEAEMVQDISIDSDKVRMAYPTIKRFIGPLQLYYTKYCSTIFVDQKARQHLVNCIAKK